MIVPILTLSKLQKAVEESFIYVPEIDIWKETKEDKKEIDLCCVLDGEIFIGECKTSKTVNQKDIKKYFELATEVGAQGLIFSTLSPEWSEGTRNNILKLSRDKELKIKLYKHDDLI